MKIRNLTLIVALSLLPFWGFSQISTYPYLEDFESGPGGWTAGGTNSSWELGTPNGQFIKGAASGDSAWMTGLMVPHNAGENSAVTSPVFDMTNAPADAWVALSVWWEAETDFDGAVLQATTDGGTNWFNIGDFGDPFNWYNNDNIPGQPGGQSIGWSGDIVGGDSIVDWVSAQHPLDASVIGQSAVQFRIAFGTDGNVNLDGFAFDDFAIASLPSLDFGDDSLEFCIGNVLSVPFDSVSTYEWSTGDSTNFITFENTTGADTTFEVSLQLTNAFGVTAVDTVVVTVSGTDSIPAPSFTFATFGATVEFTNTTPNGTSFAWDFGENSTSTSMDEDPTYVYSTDDTFVVTLTVTNDCGTAMATDTVFMTTVSIENERLASNVALYPNPTQGTFQLAFGDQALEEVRVKVYSVDGRVVYSQALGYVSGSIRHEVQLDDHLTRGMYLVQISTKNALISKRIRLD